MAIPVTALYAGILGLMLVALSATVVAIRWRDGVGIGHGQSKPLRRWIRVHANFTEYVPIAALLLGICELNGVAASTVHTLGGALVAVRVAHIYGLSRYHGPSIGRFVGACGTFVLLLVLSGLCAWTALA
jgi:uncharacterized membrane protein YecN with MAPEG domain